MNIIFNSFVEIEKISPLQIRSYQEMWDEVRSLMEDAKADGLFGINLLHKHFDILPGESFLEKYIKKSNNILIRPVQANTPELAQAEPMMWAVSGEKDSVFSYQSGADMKPLSIHQNAVLLSALGIIRKHNLHKTFGIWRLDRYKNVWGETRSSEVTLVKQRLHILQPQDLSYEGQDGVIETRWDVYMKAIADCHPAPTGHYGD